MRQKCCRKGICTANHNVCEDGSVQQEIGLVKEYTNPIVQRDIIIVTLSANCPDDNEDWAIYERSSGNFAHYALMCPENELPTQNERIGIRDFPVGLMTSMFSEKITLQSFHSKVAQYEVFKPMDHHSRKRKFTGARVVAKKPARASERGLLVRGGRVKGSCGAAYFAPNGKVAAFHVESVDDGSDCVSESNSYTSDRSHESYSRSLVLCRLLKFKQWYDHTVVPIVTHIL